MALVHGSQFFLGGVQEVLEVFLLRGHFWSELEAEFLEGRGAEVVDGSDVAGLAQVGDLSSEQAQGDGDGLMEAGPCVVIPSSPQFKFL